MFPTRAFDCNLNGENFARTKQASGAGSLAFGVKIGYVGQWGLWGTILSLLRAMGVAIWGFDNALCVNVGYYVDVPQGFCANVGVATLGDTFI